MKLIIYHPQKQTNKQRWMLEIVTMAFWAFWIYLWLPLISLLAWFLGIYIFEHEMIELGGYRGLLAMLGTYGLVILLLGGCLIGWAVYNIGRFSQSAARRSTPHITTEEQAHHFNVDIKQLEKWRKSQRLMIEHDANSAITGVHMF